MPSTNEHRREPAPNDTRFSLDTLGYGHCEEIRHATHASRDETACRPDQAYIPDVAYKLVENRDDVGMAEFIGKRNLGE